MDVSFVYRRNSEEAGIVGGNCLLLSKENITNEN